MVERGVDIARAAEDHAADARLMWDAWSVVQPKCKSQPKVARASALAAPHPCDPEHGHQ